MEDNLNSLPSEVNQPTQAIDKKKIIIIAGAVVFVLLLMIVAIFTSSSGNNRKTQNLEENSVVPTNIPSVSSQITPDMVAKDFYSWYVNSPDPIKSGEYESRSQITPEFKDVMGRFVKRGIDPGYDHVFCESSNLPKTVRFDEPIIESTILATVMIKEDSPDGANLFQIKLKNIEGQWKIDDVWCPPAE